MFLKSKGKIPLGASLVHGHDDIENLSVYCSPFFNEIVNVNLYVNVTLFMLVLVW